MMHFEFKKLVDKLAWIIAKSYLATQFARRVVKYYDNDSNDDILQNGESSLLSQIVKLYDKDTTFIDVGANIGSWSKILVEAGFTGNLIAVDPLKENLVKVDESLVRLNFRNYKLLECALSNYNGRCQFFVNRNRDLSGHDSLFNMNEIGYRDLVDKYEIDVSKLDDLAQEYKCELIGFVKIDVEGNELNVLQGAQNLLENGCIDYIQIEFGHSSRASRTYLHDIVNLVEKYNYQQFVIKPKGISPLRFDPFTENKYSQVNLLFVKSSRVQDLGHYILDK